MSANANELKIDDIPIPNLDLIPEYRNFLKTTSSIIGAIKSEDIIMDIIWLTLPSLNW